MSPARVIFLGGNGHAAVRLGPARAALAARGQRSAIEIVEVPYPGFEDRPRAPDLQTFLDAVSARVGEAAGDGSSFLIYATGIGGLLALCLRARGEHTAVPLLLQAPVLWGLARRWMPRVMRALPPLRRALPRLFARPGFQARFIRKYFTTTPAPELTRAFFDGYARCAALPDLFAWLDPALLHDLEAKLPARRGAMDGITVWWGARDRVVTQDELRWTERALGVRWPVKEFPAWGHYPMIDDPGGWVDALVEAC